MAEGLAHIYFIWLSRMRGQLGIGGQSSAGDVKGGGIVGMGAKDVRTELADRSL